MKKVKLLLATPLLLTPSLSLVPAVTSCSKSDLTISSDFASNVDVVNITKELHKEEPYVIMFYIKQDKVGDEFLPSTLTKVTSGGKELTQLLSSNVCNEYDYYSYYVNDDHTVGLLSILSAQGPINIEAKTTQLKSVVATGVDLITGESTVEFEIGETVGDLATRSRVLAIAQLENDEYFFITSKYTFELDGYETGTTFTAEQTQLKKGKVVYYGMESNEFDFKVIKTTQAYLSYPVDWEENKVVKCSSINDAVNKYNELDTTGSYTITILSNSETFKLDKPLSIKQNANKHLTITSDSFEYVKLQANYDDKDYLIDISYVGTAASENSSITINGIIFEKPLNGTSSTFNDIVLRTDSAVDAPHNITIDNCSFIGDEDDEDGIKINAVCADDAGGKLVPYGITINACSGYFLNTLFSGKIAHNSTKLLDLMIAACYTIKAQKVIDIKSTTDCSVLIDGVVGSVMYTKEGTTTNNQGGMTISGAGTYWIRNCMLIGLTDSSSTAGFIEVTATEAGTSQTRQLVLSSLTFISSDENMHTVYDSYEEDGVDWNIQYKDDEGSTTATVNSKPGEGESDTWDIKSEE